MKKQSKVCLGPPTEFMAALTRGSSSLQLTTAMLYKLFMMSIRGVDKIFTQYAATGPQGLL